MPASAPAPGDGMRELVAVMDRLRSPGGCPWDAEQTHESLVPYALEEAFEVAEAIEVGDRTGMREELGDLLLQVVFHARLAQEHRDDPFDLDDVARGITAKLIRRHPHVFGPAAGGATSSEEVVGDAPDADEVHSRWERIKKVEKQRTSVLEGIPLTQGALARGQKVLSRARRAGLALDAAGVAERHRAEAASDAKVDADVGARLLALAAEAEVRGVDAEAALRAAVRTLEVAVRASEAD